MREGGRERGGRGREREREEDGERKRERNIVGQIQMKVVLFPLTVFVPTTTHS